MVGSASGYLVALRYCTEKILFKKDLKRNSKLFVSFLFSLYLLDKYFFAVLLVIVSSCPAGEFTCTSGECLSAQLVCDFKKDCKDGSDEEFCGMLAFLNNHNLIFPTSVS